MGRVKTSHEIEGFSQEQSGNSAGSEWDYRSCDLTSLPALYW